MLILLQFICLGLWFSMMLMLGLARPVYLPGAGFYALELHDCATAERQIYETLRRLRPDIRLQLILSQFHPDGAELCYIVDSICRKYPAILVQYSGAEGK